MIARDHDTTPDEGIVDLASRRPDVVRRLLARGISAQTLAAILPALESDIVAATAEFDAATVDLETGRVAADLEVDD